MDKASIPLNLSLCFLVNRKREVSGLGNAAGDEFGK
jgi:hypothetical protein